MAGKGFGGLVLMAAIAVVMALPAGASATPGTYFQILGPADGHDVGVIPFNPSYPLFDTVNYSFAGVALCHYSGNGVDETPGGCTTSDYERPTVDGVYTLTINVPVMPIPAMTPIVADTATSTFELDQTPPVISITPIANNSTNDSTPTFSFTATDLNLANVECRIGGGSFALCGSTFTPAVPLADSSSSYSFDVRAYDDAGTQATASYNFFVDTVAPEVSILYPTPGVTVDSSVPEVNLSIAGLSSVGGGAFCRYDDQPYQPCSASWTGGSLADGAHRLWVKVSDAAGNEREVFVDFFVDDSLGATPIPYETSITGGNGGKVKRGKFKVKAGFSLLGPEGSDATVLCAAKVKATLKPKGGRTYTDRIQLMNKNGRCVASTTFTLPKRFKGKRAKLTFRYPGTAALGVLSRSKTITKL